MLSMHGQCDKYAFFSVIGQKVNPVVNTPFPVEYISDISRLFVSFLCFLGGLVSRNIHYTTLSPLKLDVDAALTTCPLQPHHVGATGMYLTDTSIQLLWCF